MTERERRLEPTVSPLTLKIILGFAYDQEIGKSTAAARFIQKAIDCMPENVQKKYIDIYNKNLK